MSKAWIPSVLGRHFTRSATWHLELNGVELTLTVSGRVHKVNVEEEETYRIQSGLLWTDIGFYTEQELEVRVDGLPQCSWSRFEASAEFGLGREASSGRCDLY